MKKLYLCLMFLFVFSVSSVSACLISDFSVDFEYKMNHQGLTYDYIPKIYNWYMEPDVLISPFKFFDISKHIFKFSKIDISKNDISTTIPHVTEPSTMVLLGIGFIGLASVKRRKIFK